jgi:RNA polymerase sigma factor (sigma-70 family)
LTAADLNGHSIPGNGFYDPSESFAAKQRGEMLRAALLELTQRQRIVLVLRAKGKTVREIGALLEVSHVTILGIERGALAKMRSHFADRGIKQLAGIL